MWHCLTAGLGGETKHINRLDSGWWKSVLRARRNCCILNCVCGQPLFHLVLLQTSTCGIAGITRCPSMSMSYLRVRRANVWRRMRRVVPGDYANPLMRESMMCCLTVFILSKVKSLTTQKPLIACFNLPRRRNLEMRVVLYADSHRFRRLQMKGALDGNEQGKQSLRFCRSCSAHISQVAMNMSTRDSEACSPLNS